MVKKTEVIHTCRDRTGIVDAWLTPKGTKLPLDFNRCPWNFHVCGIFPRSVERSLGRSGQGAYVNVEESSEFFSSRLRQYAPNQPIIETKVDPETKAPPLPGSNSCQGWPWDADRGAAGQLPSPPIGDLHVPGMAVRSQHKLDCFEDDA